jgi:hypothetical protein
MKRNFKNATLFFLAIAAALTSCQEVIELDLPEGEEFLAVEGWITNEDRPHDIILTTTAAYFDSSDPAPVSNANVFIRDDQGMEMLLPETDLGVYTYPDSGIVGHSYQNKRRW